MNESKEGSFTQIYEFQKHTEYGQFSDSIFVPHAALPAVIEYGS